MNKLSYKMNKEDTLWKEREGFQVVLDGIPSRWFFNVEEFEKSSKESGFYPILLHFCLYDGCPDCVYGEVIQEGGKIIWRRFFSQIGGDGVSEEGIDMRDGNEAYEVRDLFITKDASVKAPLSFDKTEYLNLAEELTRIKNEQAIIHNK